MADHNDLRYLPKELANCSNMKCIAIRFNPELRTIPLDFYKLNNLAWLGVDNIEEISNEIITQGAPAILTELEKLYFKLHLSQSQDS